jgi:hypothetical protein
MKTVNAKQVAIRLALSWIATCLHSDHASHAKRSNKTEISYPTL